MNFSQNSNKGKASNAIAAALTLLVTASVSCQAALAQEAPSAGSYSSSSTLGPDQDSLLPPEVVPLDPSTASSLSAAQAQKRQSSPLGSSYATEGSIVPGLVETGIPNGMQTAKDARNAAFQSLYGQGQLPQQQPMLQGSQSFVGQQPMINGSGSAPYGAVAQQPMPTQSQTLSGGSKHQAKIRDIRRGGISNTLSALAGFTGGAVAATALMRPYNPAMGLGMFGLTMTGFGVRNAFRF